ncbi:MAG: hypothetical protein AAGF26_11890, partial [Cyanobacteria bacterium P01_G01_bin.49]
DSLVEKAMSELGGSLPDYLTSRNPNSDLRCEARALPALLTPNSRFLKSELGLVTFTYAD